jgi:hypothetical protein
MERYGRIARAKSEQEGQQVVKSDQVRGTCRETGEERTVLSWKNDPMPVSSSFLNPDISNGRTRLGGERELWR